MPRVGVLALQGDFLEHLQTLTRLGVEVREVRLPADLNGTAALIIPGGESTTIARLMDLYCLREPIKELIKQGIPVWGTCAGMIVLAKTLTDDRPVPIGAIDIKVQRNSFGRQVASFETDLPIAALGDKPFRAVFIRAPVILEAGQSVEVLANLPEGRPVAARQGRVLVTAFHPELTEDTRFHSYFLSLAKGDRIAS